MIVCVAANPAVDMMYVVGQLEVGRIHRPSQVVRTPGGKALNVARVTRAVDDVAVGAVAVLGGPGGVWIAEQLATLGIDTHVVETSSTTRSCISVADPDGLTEFYEPGLAYEEAHWHELSSLTLEQAGPGVWISISGSLPTSTPPEVVADLVTLARRTGAQVAVDLAEPWLTPVLDAEPDLVKVNLTEARAALDGADEDDTRGLLHRLAEPGRLTVLTCGDKGAVMSDGHQNWRCELPETGPYPVGSGDALLAGMLVAASRDAFPPDALRLGTATAVANAKQPGAGELDEDEVKRLLNRIEVTTW